MRELTQIQWPKDGVIVEEYNYDVYGAGTGIYTSAVQVIRTESNIETTCAEPFIIDHHLPQVKEYVQSIDRYYYRARWYDPNTGRWLSKDPIGIAGGLNQYVFCGNNPVNFTDPLGLISVEDEVANALLFSPIDQKDDSWGRRVSPSI